MAGLTKNQLAGMTRDELEEMVKGLKKQWRELAERHSDLQEEHINLQIEYGQYLRKKIAKYENPGGKKKAAPPQHKESLACDPEVNGKEGGADHGI